MILQIIVGNEKMTFPYLLASSSKISEPFTAHCKFFRQIYQKKMMIFTKIWFFFFSFQWLFQCFCQVIIPKKILTQVPMAKKTPKNAKKCQFWSLFWPFFDLFLSFWWPSLCGELRGYRTEFGYISLQNMKKNNISDPGMRGTPCLEH